MLWPLEMDRHSLARDGDCSIIRSEPAVRAQEQVVISQMPAIEINSHVEPLT